MSNPGWNRSLPVSRRDFLRRAGCGAGMLAMASLLSEEGLLAADAPSDVAPVNPLLPKAPHFPARAKNVIFLFI